MANAAKIMARYRELENLAYDSLNGRSFFEKDVQERIRSFALIREIEEENETSSQERGSTPKLIQESGWQSDGQIGATGSKI
jgi:hypothetical protein